MKPSHATKIHINPASTQFKNIAEGYKCCVFSTDSTYPHMSTEPPNATSDMDTPQWSHCDTLCTIEDFMDLENSVCVGMEKVLQDRIQAQLSGWMQWPNIIRVVSVYECEELMERLSVGQGGTWGKIKAEILYEILHHSIKAILDNHAEAEATNGYTMKLQHFPVDISSRILAAATVRSSVSRRLREYIRTCAYRLTAVNFVRIQSQYHPRGFPYTNAGVVWMSWPHVHRRRLAVALGRASERSPLSLLDDALLERIARLGVG